MVKHICYGNPACWRGCKYQSIKPIVSFAKGRPEIARKSSKQGWFSRLVLAIKRR